MGKFFTWLIGLVLVGALAYGGWSLYNQLNPQVVQAAAAYQTVKLATGSISSTVSATGPLRSNQHATVSWNATGTIGAVPVKIGDQVNAGDILASLDPKALPKNILIAMVDLYLSQQQLNNLTQTQATLPAAEKAVINAQTALDKAQSHRDLMNYDPRGTDQQIAQSLAGYLQAEAMVERLRAYYEKLPGDPATELHNKAPALLNLQKAIDNRNLALSTVNWYKGHWTPTEIAAADSALAVAKAKLADAQTALTKIKGGPDPAKLASIQHHIDADESIISTQTLTAPISGTVTVVNSKVGSMVFGGSNTNGVVTTGTVSFRIDDLSAYFVDLQVSEVDIAKVQVGQPATINFDAIPNKTYTGLVTYVAAVGNTTNGLVNFIVTVQLTNPDALIKTGLTAQGNILVNTVENVMVVPSKAVKTVGGKNVVFVLSSTPANTTPVPGSTPTSATGFIKPPVAGETETVIPVVVTVGASSDTSTQITSSRLKAGDLIVLNPPSSAVTAAQTVVNK